jgi:NADPH-dependent curcumin reductase CurA
MTETIQRIVLASRPVGEPTLDNFRLEKHPVPQPEPGQMLLRTLWLSLDPYMRGRMSDAPSYAKPVGIGDVMEGGAVSEVIDSHVPEFAKGDIVVGRTGWQTHALSDGSGLEKVDPTRAPIQTALGVLGISVAARFSPVGASTFTKFPSICGNVVEGASDLPTQEHARGDRSKAQQSDRPNSGYIVSARSF